MPMIPHNRVHVPSGAGAAVAEVVTSGKWACGMQTQRFESLLRRNTGRHYATAVASGVSALRLALLGAGVQAADEVIVPAYSCVALANAVLSIGAIPVAVDVQQETWVLTPAHVAPHITPRTRAIIAVHTFGYPCNIAGLKQLGVPVIEDCAHAFGRGRFGLEGDAAISSLYATKLLGAGEGGFILTDATLLHTYAHNARDYSDQPPSGQRLNDKLTDMEATLATLQLKALPAMLKKRDAIATHYRKWLGDALAFHVTPHHAERITYRFTLTLAQQDAPRFIQAMRRKGVACAEPVHPWLDDLSAFPVAQRAFRHVVSLPCYPGLSVREIRQVVDAVKGCV